MWINTFGILFYCLPKFLWSLCGANYEISKWFRMANSGYRYLKYVNATTKNFAYFNLEYPWYIVCNDAVKETISVYIKGMQQTFIWIKGCLERCKNSSILDEDGFLLHTILPKTHKRRELFCLISIIVYLAVNKLHDLKFEKYPPQYPYHNLKC